MPRRNGSERFVSRAAAGEVRRHATALKDDAVALGMAGKRLGGEALHHAGESAQYLYEQGRTRVMDFEESLEENIRAYPIRSIFLAFGVGYLFGRYWHR
jgi:hypothetical protein